MKLYLAIPLLATGFLAACSGFTTYPDRLASNLDIHTRMDSGSMLSNVEAALDVYSVNPDCSTDYDGTVELDSATVSVGLPVDRPSYLVFRFNSSSFLAGSSSVTRYDTLFTPGDGRRYDVEVSYLDAIYNVAISEKSNGSSAPRVIETQDLRACRR